ncbi:MAG: 50S ribosomal protein L6 [Candidatus Colwellbacteria bacterium]|nr:50S ribosomal protein L6 [Candidatus Colwellbacteria bacterium]
MSKIGKKPIKIPEGVLVEIKDSTIQVKGKNSTNSVNILHGIKPEIKDGFITLAPIGDSKQVLSNWGTMGALITNAVHGAKEDFIKELSVVGVGYRASVEGEKLVLNIGFSHPVKFQIPKGIKVKVEKNIIQVIGPDKSLVGEITAKIRKIKKPEPYQGRGIRYKNEVVRKKQGKKAAAATGAAK